MLLKNGKTLTIAKADRTDAEKLIEYLNIVGGESDNLLFGKNGFHLSVKEEEDHLESLKGSQTCAIFAGKVDGEIVCVGNISAPSRERIAHQADLGLSVKKAYWNMGIGSALIQVLIDFAKTNGKTEVIYLGVKADNTNARHLYEKAGFTKIGVYERFFKIDGIYYDKIMMNLYLSEK
ncbi:MAG: GNAT family N-acetyltransferase [Oscillospiraceae bacterium]|nr:GNAT family N-acetyltransferase [Oscillospiraceae bacterium]